MAALTYVRYWLALLRVNTALFGFFTGFPDTGVKSQILRISVHVSSAMRSGYDVCICLCGLVCMYYLYADVYVSLVFVFVFVRVGVGVGVCVCVYVCVCAIDAAWL